MKPHVVLIISLLILGGCSENLAVQSMRRGIAAIEDGNYKEARSYLAFAQTEGEDPEYEAIYLQIQSFLDMMDYLDQGELDEALLSWTDLNLIKTKSQVMKEVAVIKMQEMLQEVITSCEEGIEAGDYEEQKGMLNQIVKRLGDMSVFEKEMLKIQQLRRQMN